jgi:hypothetical protein
MGQLERRAAADMPTMPRTPRGNQFAEAGEMALEGTGLPQVRRGAETLGDVAQAPYQPNAPMRALGGLGELGLGVASAATIGELGGVRPRGRVPMQAPRMPEAPAAPQSDPEALSLARSWIDSFGGGPSAEARAIEVMTEHMQEARNPAWRQRLADAIDSVGSRAYVQGERTSFSQRVEDAWPEIYGGAATPDPSPPRTRPPTAVEPGPGGGGGGQRVVTGQPFRTTAYRSGAGDTWFSADRRTAATYGDEVRNQPIEMRNPLVVDAQGSEYYDIPANLLPAEARGAAVGQRMRHTTTDALAEFAEANGYDGVVIQNVWDGSGARPGARTDTVYRTFESQRITRPPTQIAPNGMPIRPPQPFRNSLRGGNDDLAEAARMRDRGERP